MTEDINRILMWRLVTVLGVAVAFLLTLMIPQHMRENSDWAFLYSVKNYSQGQFSVDTETLNDEIVEVNGYGGALNQYVQANNGRWILTTEAPGYIFFLLPFYYIHAPRLGILLLTACVVLIFYLLLKFFRDERTACLGSLLLLFNPVFLALMQRVYVDSFGAFAFLSIGGGLYIYYCLRRQELAPRSSALILFLAGLGLGWSVFASYYNIFPVAVFALHFIYTCVQSIVSGKKRAALLNSFWLCLGFVMPVAGLLLYQNSVFGSPWSFGFQHSQFYTGLRLNLIYTNLLNVTIAVLAGFPLLMPAFASIWMAFSAKLEAGKDKRRQTVKTGNWPELPWNILLLLSGWIAVIYGLYLCYEGTATSQAASMPVIVMARYYLPALFPITLMTALILKHIPRKLSLAITIMSFVWGVVFFTQAALSYYAVAEHNPYNPVTSVLPEKSEAKPALLPAENYDMDTGTWQA